MSPSARTTSRSRSRAATGRSTSVPARTRTWSGGSPGGSKATTHEPPAPEPISRSGASAGIDRGSRTWPHSRRTVADWIPQRSATAARTRASSAAPGAHVVAWPKAAPGPTRTVIAATAGASLPTASSRRRRRRSANHRIGDLGHLLAHLHRLRVDLVGAQGADHVHHLADDLDVARFQAPLDEPPEAVFLRVADGRHPRRRSLGVQV